MIERPVSGDAKFENVKFDDSDENQVQIGWAAKIDTRQDAQLPRDAVYIGGGWDHLRLLETEESFNRFTVDLRGYKTFIGRTILAAQGYYRSADGRLPDWERPFLGGAQTVRGYDAGEFIGDNIALLAVEWRVPLHPEGSDAIQAWLFPFFDYGRSWNRRSAR